MRKKAQVVLTLVHQVRLFWHLPKLLSMKVALINSAQDRAGVNIRKRIEVLLDESREDFRKTGRTYEFHEVEGRLIHADGVDAGVSADLMIFLSRHASINPVPVLTVHVTGNLREAELGGSPRSLPPASPVMMQAVLRELVKNSPPGYRASYEVTHHGPTDLRIPSFFVEIGSTEKEWVDESAGRVVAQSVLAATPADSIPLIGFAGNHYAARQTEISLTSRGAFGHIAHSREVGSLDEGMIRMMQEKTRAVAAYIDKKALEKDELYRLIGQLDALGIVRLSETELSDMGALPWATYCAARVLAGTFSAGAHCHVHAMERGGQLEMAHIDTVLLSETLKADEHAFLQGLDGLPVIHLSGADSRPLPVFFTYAEYTSRIINDLNTLCVKIIRIKEITTRDGDHLIIQKVRFDPQKARTLGVPAGPLYKALAAGQAVEVSGRVVTPAMVSCGSEIRIHIPGLENIA
jgi:D-aminoacyl-tRNA deacylase